MGNEVVTRFVLLTTIVGAAALVIPWLFWVATKLRAVCRQSQAALEMLEHPQASGFGTLGFEGVIRDNTRAIRELSHYVRWNTQEQTGKAPPPYVG